MKFDKAGPDRHPVQDRYSGLKDKKEILYQKYLHAHENKEFDYDFTRLNAKYIAGLFDAEGYCYMQPKQSTGKFTKQLYMKITQKNHPKLLFAIQKYLGFGRTIDNEKFVVAGLINCMKFIDVIKPYLIVKANQVQCMQKYIETSKNIRKTGYTDKNHQLRSELYEIMVHEKHANEDYSIPETVEMFGFNQHLNKSR